MVPQIMPCCWPESLGRYHFGHKFPCHDLSLPNTVSFTLSRENFSQNFLDRHIEPRGRGWRPRVLVFLSFLGEVTTWRKPKSWNGDGESRLKLSSAYANVTVYSLLSREVVGSETGVPWPWALAPGSCALLRPESSDYSDVSDVFPNLLEQ